MCHTRLTRLPASRSASNLGWTGPDEPRTSPRGSCTCRVGQGCVGVRGECASRCSGFPERCVGIEGTRTSFSGGISLLFVQHHAPLPRDTVSVMAWDCCVKSEELHSRNDGSAPWRVAASPGERRTHLCYHHAAATTHVLPLHPRQPWLRGPALAGQAGVYDTTPSSPSVARWWWLGGGGPVHRHVNSQAEETRGQGDSCGCLAGPLQAPYHACWRRGFPDAPRNPNPRPSYLRV